jgi:uncharacterized protein (DUF927 family)
VKKEIRPFIPINDKYEPRELPEPHPLYNLLQIIRDLHKPILVVEGEKSVETAKALFPDWVVTTSCEGAAKSDWSPLANREIVICFDYDTAGIKYADDVCWLSQEAGCVNIQILDIHMLVKTKLFKSLHSEEDEGYDLADGVSDGLTEENCTDIKDCLFLIESTVSAFIQAQSRKYFESDILPILQESGFERCVELEILKQVLAQHQDQIQEVEEDLKQNREELSQVFQDLKLNEKELPFLQLAEEGLKKEGADKESIKSKKDLRISTEKKIKALKKQRENLEQEIASLQNQCSDLRHNVRQNQDEQNAIVQALHQECINIKEGNQDLRSALQGKEDLCDRLAIFEANTSLLTALAPINRSLSSPEEESGTNEKASLMDEADYPEGFPRNSYRMKTNGSIEYQKEFRLQGCTYIEWKWLCQAFIAEYQLRDKNSGNWSKAFTFKDSDYVEKEIIITPELLAGNYVELKQKLLSAGLSFNLQAMAQLSSYSAACHPKKRARLTLTTGWYGNSHYVLPHKTYGVENEEIVRLSSETKVQDYAIRGTLSEWQEHVGKYAESNPILQLGILLALSSVLLTPLNRGNFGLHILGNSSCGKSTVLHVVASVFGVEFRSWRTSDNAAESWGMLSNDNIMILDDIGQALADVVAQMIYMLGNGQGKGRANRNGIARDVIKFKVCFLSSGELDIETKLNDGKWNQTYCGGQSVRLIEIQADAGKGYGVFEYLHGFQDGAALSKHLVQSAAANSGVLGDAWLEYLVRNRESVKEEIKVYEAEFADRAALEEDADGQVKRVCDSFSLMAATGEVMINAGLLNWSSGQAINACISEFSRWIAARGGMESHELNQLVTDLKEFFEKYGSARFENAWAKKIMNKSTPSGWKEGTVDDIQKILNRAGFRKPNDTESAEMPEEWTYYFLPEVLKKEILKGKNPKTILPKLIEKGILVPDNQGKSTVSVRIPGEGQMRLHQIGKFF